MSKSAESTTTATTREPRRRARSTARNAAPAAETASPPAHGQLEVEHIEYAPAIAAADDLLTWALDLATANVADWPAGKRRVKRARSYLDALVRGKRPRGRCADEDVAFTAGLLVRILDEDLNLGLGPIAALFDELGLPSEHVPRAASTPHASAGPSIPPASLRHLRAIYVALTPIEAEAAHAEAMTMSPAERARWAQGLARLPVPAAVALVRSYLFGPDAEPMEVPGGPVGRREAPVRRGVGVRFAEGATCTGCPLSFRVAA